MRSFTNIIFILFGVIAFADAKQYVLDIMEVESNTTTPDKIDIDLKPTQPSRGVYAISGHLEFKEDIDSDKAIAQVKIYYSSNGISYQLTPFRIAPKQFTQALNVHYKQYLMKEMTDCCTDAPAEDVFVSPFTKRVIACENCIFPSDNFPSGLRHGYYRLVILISDNPTMDMALSILLKLENE